MKHKPTLSLKRLLDLNTSYFFLAIIVLALAIASYLLLSQRVFLDSSKYDISQIKVTALPGKDQADAISDANDMKGDNNAASTNPTGSKNSAKSVCLDPGHGGDDPGAIKGKLWERDINLIAANKASKLLKNKGYDVYLTRTTNDEGLSKKDRYTFCNEKNASILVAIHHNTYNDSSVNYASALYYTEQDQLLAESVARSVSSALKIENKGIAWFDNSVLSKSKMPAIFSEAFFMTNGAEYSKLVKKDYSRLDKEAEGIVNGIENYFANPSQFKPTFAAEELEIHRTDW